MTLVFDSGPIISLATNSLLWVLKELKKKHSGNFYIPGAVKFELIDKPFRTKRFKLEAMQVMQKIRDDILIVLPEDDIKSKAKQICDTANSIFFVNERPLTIVHPGEMEALVAVVNTKADALVIDERTTRLLIESPESLKNILKRRLHANIIVDSDKLKLFTSYVKGVKVLRSAEIMAAAFEIGILDDYVPKVTKYVPEPRRELLDAVLWGLKIRGCAISEKEIKMILSYAMT